MPPKPERAGSTILGCVEIPCAAGYVPVSHMRPVFFTFLLNTNILIALYLQIASSALSQCNCQRAFVAALLAAFARIVATFGAVVLFFIAVLTAFIALVAL